MTSSGSRDYSAGKGPERELKEPLSSRRRITIYILLAVLYVVCTYFFAMLAAGRL